MTDAELSFTLERTYPAPPEQVFAFFTQPGRMASWFCPNPGLTTTCDLDVRVGGQWACTMGGYAVRGSYVEVEPPLRLAFTWAWDSDPDLVTTVGITLAEVAGGTRLTLDHAEDGPTDEGHEFGWKLSLDRLTSTVQSS